MKTSQTYVENKVRFCFAPYRKVGPGLKVHIPHKNVLFAISAYKKALYKCLLMHNKTKYWHSGCFGM